MNIVINLIVLFIFLNLMFFMEIPNLTVDDFIFHKIILFLMIGVFQFLQKVIMNMYARCIIDIKNLAEESLFDGGIAVIGYSLVLDLIHMSSTSYMVTPYVFNSLWKNVFVSLSIIVFMLLTKVIKLTFGYRPNKCINDKLTL